MKKFFKAVANKISPFKSFAYTEGNRSAVVKAKRFPFVQTINSEYSTNSQFSRELVTDSQITIGVGFKKKSLEEKKQAAQNYCKTGQATPK